MNTTSPISVSTRKLNDLVRSSTTCLYTHPYSKRPVPSCPVGRSVITDDGSIWFFLDLPGNATREQTTHRAQLFYGNAGTMEYLSITGEGTVQDPADENASAAIDLLRDANDGLQPGPEHVLIRVRPGRAYYWNTRTGKLHSLLSEDQSASVY